MPPHVLSRSRNELLLIGSDRLIPLNGRFFTSPSNDVDLGLTEEQRTECRGAVFLTTDDVDRTDEGGDRLRYYVPGFRAVDNEPGGTPPTNVISIGSAHLAHAAPANTYQILGLSPSSHLVVSSHVIRQSDTELVRAARLQFARDLPYGSGRS